MHAPFFMPACLAAARHRSTCRSHRDEDVLARLGLEPWHIARTADAARLGVTLPAKVVEHRAEWLDLMSTHPRLIQRPILTASDGTTVVGRDPDSLSRVIAAE